MSPHSGAGLKGVSRPAATTLYAAGEFDTAYESVVTRRDVGLLEDRDAKRAALARLMATYAPRQTPGEDYLSITGEEVGRTAVISFATDACSGKRNRGDPADETAAFDPDWRSASR